MALKFSEGNHQYRLDGQHITSVTTALNGGLPKKAIPYWAARMVAEFVAENPALVGSLYEADNFGVMVAALKEVPWATRNKAAKKGTALHALARQVLLGEAITDEDMAEDPSMRSYLEPFTRWADAWEIEVLHTELQVANRTHWYAGTLDAIVIPHAGDWRDRRVLVDWKTGAAIYGEVSPQTAAYARAETCFPTPGDEQPMPEVDCTGVLHLTADGADFFPLAWDKAEIDEQFDWFLACHKVSRIAKPIAEIIKDPLPLQVGTPAAIA